MRLKRFITAAVIILAGLSVSAQQKQWTLTECIDHALNANIQVRKADVSTGVGKINLQQAKDNRWPDLSASAGQNFGWKQITDNTGTSVLQGSSRTSLSAGSNVALFSGFRVKNEIVLAELNYKGLMYSTEVTKESVSLSIMNAYLQVLYAEEQITNSRNQADATRQELGLAKERFSLGAIANSDYLQVKTQLASEELTLSRANSTFEIDRVILMQLIELPADSAFEIARPDIDAIISTTPAADAADVYSEALKVKPEIKYAEINKESSLIDLDLAKGGYYPSLSMNAGVSTAFADAALMGSEIRSNFAPSVGLSLSVPIFSNNQNKSSVSRAKAGMTTAELDELDAKNQLRKEIEQACLDARSAVINYNAAVNQYEASLESYKVAEEKFNLGAMNSVDFLIQKTNLTSSESSLLQAKYELVFSYKIIDFYKGIPLSL
ncbi:MAG: TolC family protein [Bacteroidales bacterium]